MTATVDKAALTMLLAKHEVGRVNINHASWNHGWSASAMCGCGHCGPIERRADHYADVLLEDVAVWLLPD